ncbi:SURF1 family protein [Sphingomonas japonica]|uniref:SURF1-like protein n=1 Tax=Sphingomonas japonica TaxID=511662 RepID=A0ABX0TZN5_9SPHN|nr:SURF1 family protein [Sphingomonas japonica]NIJ23775.1 cytochrome oxidase assembly protein ShyY1 [Sphingomonas japonica]
MRRLPILSTIVVVAAIALMIALGVWQLDRRAGKEALLARYASNDALPAIAFPLGAADESVLFRTARLDCRSPGDWRREGGRAADGSNGYRHLATCANGAVVELGVASDPSQPAPDWPGGVVTGTITYAPDPTPVVQRMLGGGSERRLMLVATEPVAGLKASRRPDPSGIPNNHLAYAVQWFLFAGIAGVIYLLAVRRRGGR